MEFAELGDQVGKKVNVAKFDFCWLGEDFL